MVTGVFLLHLEGESKSQGDLDTNSSFVYYPLPNCNGGFFAAFAAAFVVSSSALSLFSRLIFSHTHLKKKIENFNLFFFQKFTM